MGDYQKIQAETYDLIVIGGGINGAGVARDAALRGLKTILIEKGDFAGATSSWSTRLVHGGLRYLEYFEFPLVRESLREREILLRTAPHLVKPLLLTVPVYGGRSRPYWKIWAGMLLYDVFSYDKSLPTHRMLPNTQFQQLFRSLDKENLKGGAQYYDAQVEYAERLCLENIIAAKQAGATILNYVEVTGLDREGKRINKLNCRDVFSGETFTVKGSPKAVVINTSGPWVDRVCKLGRQKDEAAPIGTTRKIGGTKGSHIIVDPFPGAPETSLYVEAKSDGRPFFIVPWLGMYLIGTTDIYFNENLEAIKADNDEIDYLLRETNGILPTAELSRQDVKFTYSGVRPLPYVEPSQKTAAITRKHIVYDHDKDGVENLLSLIGGKLTTYRQVAEELVEASYQKMGRPAPRCETDTPLPGAIFPNDTRIGQALYDYRPQLPLKTIHHLFSIYGARALEVLQLTDEHEELREKITPALPDIKAQLVYGVRSEMAKTLVDITRRRTTLAMHARYGLDLLPTITETLQKYAGWTQEKCDRELVAYHDYMRLNCIPDYELEAGEKAVSPQMV
ncbi:MAG: glycerol-3-phosphate dehydrogenase [Limnospira sp. PMC 1291.21]|uniref:Glycerol-3-phosphate dehydrogenase n=1 Tax=Limnospira maxima CS-328 TaxID=513049 RepID=B5W0Q5_LIMMA|nr:MULTISPECIES: glycerol-3-phosphate dehydrogenase [Limnospira]EKD06127.1 FAD dependent oxidoreductase [Arthrospira platensis C1]MDC0839054.1 glycerol-3-phosphate dehydrogenase [Limnoraphis robusta]MDY7054064.1 glycerol-3-phosphate dehydrogenase [Limnospira fusiformis LS22]QJB26692.1 glycerol-3-phosphate dehydrogenase [Limnospira fusiformis SAG 85.79]EDZ94943.1 FAD dependent oxidoreductase [Limnospira maxima CS-328]